MIHHLGCVSFLNSKPLIDPVLDNPDVQVHFAVPADLLALFDAGNVSAALMSVVDFQASTASPLLLPVGMIGCDGPTLTVRIYSRVPAPQIRELHADTDSHTSVILAQLILRLRHAVSPSLIPLKSREHVHPPSHGTAGPEAMLLIGDKVINASPDEAAYPHQFDLGQEWKLLTGLPFVFAMWMIRGDRLPEAPALAKILNDARIAGSKTTEQLLDRYAAEKSWPRDLARKYFTEYLRYEVTPHARAGLAKFFDLATQNNLLPPRRPISYLPAQ